MWRESAREGGGIIGDLGYHGIYLASRIFRQAPLSVRATASRVAAPEEEDGVEHVASLDLNYGNGRQAELTLSWLSDRRETTLDIYGSRGSLRISGDTLSLNIHGRNAERMQFESLIADSWHSAWTSATLDWFLDLLSSGARGEAWQEIAWTVSALDAAYTSVATGGVVATATQVAGHPPIHGR